MHADLQIRGELEGMSFFETKENSVGDVEVQDLCSTCMGDGSLPEQRALLDLLGEIFCIFPARMR